MRANGTLVRGHEIPAVSKVLHAVKEWAREHVTQEEIARCVVAGTFALVGYIMLVLYQAMENRTLVGF
jgi:hypothetical protein